MPSRTRPSAEWTLAFLADVVAATLERAAERGLHAAIGVVAKETSLSPATVAEWVSRARAVQAAPVPPGLLFCHDCDQPMILLQLPGCEQQYLCRPSCGRAPVSAALLRDVIAKAVLDHTPHLVPRGKTADAASYALGPVQRVAVGRTASDLHIAWRLIPRQLAKPTLSMASRLDYARRQADAGNPAAAIEALRTGLLHSDPAGGIAPDSATARAATLLAELAVAEGDPEGVVPWAGWAHRSLKALLGVTSAEARDALKALAAVHRRAGNLTLAASCYSDLIRQNTEAEGPRALPTLAAQATLALVLHQDGQCLSARQLLARTVAAHLHAHPHHRDGPRMSRALDRMRNTCIEKRHNHESTSSD
ncbi:tetratricopeptide repeat protein [Micromonospora sp. CB01531]|uniref:tetratricopeptide repeat protein n=1 Tax=Micromonospora sp. CB01531 TaxID=1718947 RepID=UPI00093A13F6|nr:tetratricopeptide repeat protein [Micromonospora sp. CB01531]OKI49342.1 hypothetical protein A6A27_34975 [Micromonospora sp. CB01531]